MLPNSKNLGIFVNFTFANTIYQLLFIEVRKIRMMLFLKGVWKIGFEILLSATQSFITEVKRRKGGKISVFSLWLLHFYILE